MGENDEIYTIYHDTEEVAESTVGRHFFGSPHIKFAVGWGLAIRWSPFSNPRPEPQQCVEVYSARGTVCEDNIEEPN